MKKIFYYSFLVAALSGAAYAEKLSHPHIASLKNQPAVSPHKTSHKLTSVREKFYFKTFTAPYNIELDTNNHITYLAVKNSLLALNSDTGELLWSQFGRFHLAEVNKNTILVERDHKLILLNKSGKTLWTRELPGSDLTRYYASAHRILIYDFSKSIEAIDWKNNNLWKLEDENLYEWRPRDEALYLFGGWFGPEQKEDSKITSIDLKTGATRWIADLSREDAEHGNYIDRHMINSPNGTLYIPTRPTMHRNRVYSVSAQGKINWNTEIPHTYLPELLFADNKGIAALVDEVRDKPGFIYFMSPDLKTTTEYKLPDYLRDYEYTAPYFYAQTYGGVFHVFDTFGKHLWNIAPLDRYIDCMKLVNQNFVITYQDKKDNNLVEFLDKETGESKGIYQTGRTFTWCYITGETLIFNTEEGYGEISLVDTER